MKIMDARLRCKIHLETAFPEEIVAGSKVTYSIE